MFALQRAPWHVLRVIAANRFIGAFMLMASAIPTWKATIAFPLSLPARPTRRFGAESLHFAKLHGESRQNQSIARGQPVCGRTMAKLGDGKPKVGDRHHGPWIMIHAQLLRMPFDRSAHVGDPWPLNHCWKHMRRCGPHHFRMDVVDVFYMSTGEELPRMDFSYYPYIFHWTGISPGYHGRTP